MQPLSGEFIAGVFEEKPDSVTLFAANYNACAGQNVKLKPAKAMKASIFDRKQGKWQDLEALGGAVEFTLIPGGGELLRFDVEIRGIGHQRGLATKRARGLCRANNAAASSQGSRPQMIDWETFAP